MSDELPPELLADSAEDLFDHAPCGYLSTTPDGTIVRVNQTFLTWTGLDRGALVGLKRFQDLLTGGGRIYHETHYAPLLRMQGAVREIALEIVCADGSRLPVLVNSTLLTDAAGEPRGVRTTVFNATDRKAYEQELLHLRKAEAEARERAEHLQELTAIAARRIATLAAISRALDEAQGVSARANRLVGMLVPELADGALVVLAEALGQPVATVAQTGATGREGGRLVDAVLRDGRSRVGDDGAGLVLRARGRVVGALAIIRAGAGAYGEDDLPFLQEIADRAAITLENALLYEEQRGVAETLQRSMLAGALPEDGRFTVAAYYQAAVVNLEVGGDWHDIFRIGTDRLGLVVGDVVGRGVDAASAMGQLRSAARALGLAGLGPAAVLERLDDFVEDLPLARSATVAYAEVALDGGEMTYACAGHPPPIVLEPGGEPELLWDGRSAPLGAYTRSLERPQATRSMPSGARLLLYTDGAVERRDRALDIGIAGLAERVADGRHLPVGRLIDDITQAFDGAATSDDVCLLAFCFGTVPAFECRVPADLAELARLRADLRTWLVANGVAGQDHDALVLACSETTANAIEHGYRGAPGVVSVRARREEDRVELVVADDGSWRPPSEGDGSRGRGIFLVEQMMDEVRIDRGDGTTVTMERRTGAVRP